MMAMSSYNDGIKLAHDNGTKPGINNGIKLGHDNGIKLDIQDGMELGLDDEKSWAHMTAMS
eukprot:3526400-Ditylum_brightwellii.AAC.1